MSEKFYITTPIYYVNAKPHIGHTYTTIAADVLARFHRLIGDKTYFAAGTDEHGAKISQKAESEGIEVQKFTDQISAEFQMAWDRLNISNDGFIRTTNTDHKKAVQVALQYMYEKGDIYLDKYEGYYCTGCEQFKNEKDLVNGKCSDHQTEPEWMSEENYVFKMSKYGDQIKEKIQKDELKIMPESRKNEILSFYENEGLKDVSFSRKNVKWGVELPWDKSHTAYVWSDAFLNYLTILSWSGKGAELPKMFPPDVQLMSKDILRVHATIWPAMLLSLDLPLQKMMFVHGFFLVDGQKMSKSIGNVIAPEELVKRYGVDATRYLLMSATVFGNDGDISWQKFDGKYTADLANGIGNLVSRVISMTEKYFEGKVPDNAKSNEVVLKDEPMSVGMFFEETFALNEKSMNFEDYMREIDLWGAINQINICVSKLDGYISEYKPFKLIKEDEEQTAAVLYNCLEGIRIISIVLWPFMPNTAEEIWKRLGLDVSKVLASDFNENIRWGGLKPGGEIAKGDSLFPRVE